MKVCLKEKEVAEEYVQDDANVAIKIMHVCVCLEKCPQGHHGGELRKRKSQPEPAP